MLSQTLQIVFHGLDPSDALKARILEEAQKLDKICGTILGGTATVEAAHRHGQHGCYALHLRLSLPGKREIVVRQDPSEEDHNGDPYRVVRAAFAVARRQLKDSVTQMRDKVKWSAGETPVGAAASGPEPL